MKGVEPCSCETTHVFLLHFKYSLVLHTKIFQPINKTKTKKKQAKKKKTAKQTKQAKKLIWTLRIY